MPSWSSRLFLGSTATSHSSPSDPSRAGREPASPSRSPPISTSRSFACEVSQHGRSASHPFPSIFGSGKKKRANGSEDEDEDIVVDAKVPLVGTPTSSVTNSTGHTPTDPMTREGKCATCDSSVRWPQHLEVYRCTVCLMINDLKPNVPNDTTSKTHELLVPFMSLKRTKRLIQEGLLHYIDTFHQGEEQVGDVGNHQQLGERLETLNTSIPEYRKVSISPNIPNHGPYCSPPLSPSRLPPNPPLEHLAPLREPSKAELGRQRSDSSKVIFRSLEKYILACFDSIDCLNASFLVAKPPMSARALSESSTVPSLRSMDGSQVQELNASISSVDAKTLLLGDVAENGMWWTGGARNERSRSYRASATPLSRTTQERISMKSPVVHWRDLNEWYQCILNVSDRAENVVEMMKLRVTGLDESQINSIKDDIRFASLHLQRTFLKASENLLRRPGRPLRTPGDCRFLLILLANPLLYPQNNHHRVTPPTTQVTRSVSKAPPSKVSDKSPTRSPNNAPFDQCKSACFLHSGITKRILGLFSNLPNDCHHHVIVWFSQLTELHFKQMVELVGGFVTYRLSRQHNCKPKYYQDSKSALVPNISGREISSSAQLHAALGMTATKATDQKANAVAYGTDWQIRAAARVMSLFFLANNNGALRKQLSDTATAERETWTARNAADRRAKRYGQVLPTSSFYNTLLDCMDLVADFEAWESRRGKFSFCQYPMFLSIWAKIHILEHDARRQMEIKAREAFFDSIMNRKAVSQFLVLRVRRECLVEDSLRNVSEVVGTGQEEIKKGLRIEFTAEEGVDAGGLRKEWFLLLIREVFDPAHGLFVYDETSHCCYFNPNSFETSDQFFLVGVVLGLAIYNSTILDVALPSFAFRKLLASAPAYTGPALSSPRPVVEYTVEDLAEFRPVLAKGLRQLLDFEGDVKETFCRDFVAEVERYGQVSQIPLCSNGENRPVTNSNRREFVDLYVRYLLETAVARQYEPFKRGFFTVCGGNALSLFRPEEIELLVRGSDEPLDVATLQAVANYEGWGKLNPAADEPVIAWFWEIFRDANPPKQRSLLSFITSSDRIPAMGATSLIIKVVGLGNGAERFPTARTCFNQIGLFNYSSRQQLELRLWRAVMESEGFGLK